MYWNSTLSIVFAIAVAYAITTFVAIFIRPLALRIGLIDRPNKRKLHKGRIPLTGGISMFCGFIFACTLLPVNLQDYRALFAGSGLLVFIGVLDDFKELSARSRLVGQLLVAIFIVAWGGVFLTNLGDLLGNGDILLPLWVGWVVSILGIVSLINATNMMDGLDGLAGLLSLVASSALLLMAIWHQNLVMSCVLSILVIIILAFLQFNYRFTQRARVFMGDAGSLFLGLVLAWFAIKGSQGEQLIARPVTMLWFFAVPLCELLTIVIHRLLHRRSPMLACRDHLHYLFVRYSEWPMWQVVLLFTFIATGLAMIGILGEIYRWPEPVMFFGFLGVYCVYAAYHFWLSKKSKKYES
ncbi:MAG: MraY family glycosyltransferase [Gammaproteobacteria bacterium]